jgi:transposase
MTLSPIFESVVTYIYNHKIQDEKDLDNECERNINFRKNLSSLTKEEEKCLMTFVLKTPH